MKPMIVMMFLVNCTLGHCAEQSQCVRQSHDGSLINGVQLPKSGRNFNVYSYLGWLLGRTYVHERLASVVLDSYRQLETALPSTQFIYGETGWANGGKFAPHKTHQNGLSVDFMVPVIDQAKESVDLPVTIKNRYGYDIEFDGQGKYKEISIDYDSMAAHLMTLDDLSKQQGFSIKKVIFDPILQPQLFATKLGSELKEKLIFNSKQAWVRHDEHYHVDFKIDCI